MSDDLVADGLEFVKRQRDRLFAACVAAGIDRSELFELESPKSRYGRYNSKVQIWAGSTPVARYWLNFPEIDGKKTIRFNIECGPVVQNALARIQADEHTQNSTGDNERNHDSGPETI